ncbi:hypothetical protein J7E38_03160 [Bacillus sp. ISL-35]|uniref:hypothetical protein n=1 Tax=Bacillus sp. ISL-35 TaxID=2819122 RepID=UPI001BE73EBC|nr:hypothetical protein [Bacillus sp. ISL-35]MBT2677982.1 hypothetical protein [Bacillus sp. ISL-35]MBT2705435.1 hypothetical protein [Chryseobacterium sp. ISL-80]
MEAIYYFDDQDQYLKIEFFSKAKESSWQAYVFDENWNDIPSSASSLSERVTETIEFAKEEFGIRGRLSIVENLPLEHSLNEAVELTLFHLQALLYSSAILTGNDCEALERYGFTKENTAGGSTVYLLASEEAEQDSCRFL